MPNDFGPTDSKETFVGRQVELNLFDEILSGRRPEWIIHIPGPGGAGKTKLLEQMRVQAHHQHNVLIVTNPVDFYRPANQTGFGLLNEICQQLGSNYFRTFSKQRTHFQQVLQSAPDPGERQEAANQVTEAFLRDYLALLRGGQRIVLLFDTCEEMHAVARWFLTTLLPGIARMEHQFQEEQGSTTEQSTGADLPFMTTIVLAGRQRLTFPIGLQSQVYTMELPSLSVEEVRLFFRQGGLGEECISANELSRLHEMSGGRPLYIALSFDWLHNQVGTAAELLSNETPFEEKLVSWVLRLRTPETRAILYAALAWRRMEPSLLAILSAQTEIEAEEIIQKLARFSFTKYRPPSEGFAGSFQLHDEMRMLVAQKPWLEQGFRTQYRLRKQIIDWYQKRIGNDALLAGNALAKDDEDRSLLAEWLYYQCELDLEAGFECHERLFRHAAHYLDLALCDLLNQELWRFRERFSSHQRDLLNFREALVDFRREDFRHASAIWHSLIRRRELDVKLKATTLMLLTELDSYTGQPAEAIEHACDAEAIYNRLILEAKDADQDSCARFEQELGQLYNNWGFAHRVRGDWASALNKYDAGLKLPGRRKNTARTLNNIGYIHFLTGDLVQARTYVGQALQMRQELGIAYELGLGYNTLGIIMEHNGRIDPAADLYRKALHNFAAAGSRRGQAMAGLNLGRLNRVINDFAEAVEYLESARLVFEELNDRDHLAEALNELGCVYRQRGHLDDWALAEKHLCEGLRLSTTLNNFFRQADNWTDLAILYYRQAAAAHRVRDDLTCEAAYQKVHMAIEESNRLAEEHGFTYLRAKNMRTMGDIRYLAGQMEKAFDAYFEACRLMAKAREQRKGSAILLQRRYEDILDRLQERLHDLPRDQQLTISQSLLAKLPMLPAQEQSSLEAVKLFVDAAIDLATRNLNICD